MDMDIDDALDVIRAASPESFMAAVAAAASTAAVAKMTEAVQAGCELHPACDYATAVAGVRVTRPPSGGQHNYVRWPRWVIEIPVRDLAKALLVEEVLALL